MISATAAQSTNNPTLTENSESQKEKKGKEENPKRIYNYRTYYNKAQKQKNIFVLKVSLYPSFPFFIHLLYYHHIKLYIYVLIFPPQFRLVKIKVLVLVLLLLFFLICSLPFRSYCTFLLYHGHKYFVTKVCYFSLLGLIPFRAEEKQNKLLYQNLTLVFTIG